MSSTQQALNVKGNFMNTSKFKQSILTILIIVSMQSCSAFSPGFGGYDKPSKRTNKYYSKNFHLTNKSLSIGKPYKNADTTLTIGNNVVQGFYFIFYANGFVLHNSTQSTPNGKNSNNLDYAEIHGEDVGSYIIKDDTIFWGTKAGYMKNHNYYSAIIKDTGLEIISQPKHLHIKRLTL
jgi:hypothetical protein